MNLKTGIMLLLVGMVMIGFVASSVSAAYAECLYKNGPMDGYCCDYHSGGVACKYYCTGTASDIYPWVSCWNQQGIRYIANAVCSGTPTSCP